MTEDSNFSGMDKPVSDKQARRRLLWVCLLLNVTILTLTSGLSIQRGFTIQITVLLTALVLLVGNGAVWLGWRDWQARVRTNRPLRPLLFFVIAVLSAISALVDLASREYGSAAFSVLCCVSMTAGALIARRNDAKRGAG